MNNEEKITVISSQKPLLPRPVMILLLLAGVAIILLAGYFYLQKSFVKKEVLPTPTLLPTPATENPNKLDNNRVSPATGGGALKIP